MRLARANGITRWTINSLVGRVCFEGKAAMRWDNNWVAKWLIAKGIAKNSAQIYRFKWQGTRLGGSIEASERRDQQEQTSTTSAALTLRAWEKISNRLRIKCSRSIPEENGMHPEQWHVDRQPAGRSARKIRAIRIRLYGLSRVNAYKYS